ncbi:protein MpCFL2 [Marchantia polymorpha subsp. ruderalis]|uniref:WW domain-containing protein n=2 Tax=Marchantia polymorpha TaxID=3197 RepID=A0A176WL24_MARPO|nr:hypothetical protein AXG93_1913s1770 [Marchantia polymorpha subsp. ruderalis]PTQ42540.1 hypothetical protein MARPO_0029s0070 [Marchantia polymorpha]BBM96941.1 hypothetical protein Mp_1g01750 [Marchantia polymorpha subsp. ruderalis]|eukprot:PTQ42540.1 hypothetical protein MARPO_0029s0070 [Marchantia polymorpha]
MIMERTAGMDNERQFDHQLDDGIESMLPSSLRKIFLELDPNPPLPAGWEKCLDLQSGNIYFKDRITGTSTYKDPRKKLSSPLRNSFGAGLSGLSDPGLGAKKHSRNKSSTLEEKLSNWNDHLASGEATKLELSLKFDCGSTLTKDGEGLLNGTVFSSKTEDISAAVEESSVCTVEKVKDALKRSHFRSLSRNNSGCTNSSLTSLQALSLNLPSPPSPSFKACRPAWSCASSSSSHSSSHSIMSFQGEESDDLKEEASSCGKACDTTNASVFADDESGVMVTLGCQRCLMYIMLPKANPCCPKCGSGDLLEILPTSLPKRQKVE